MKNFLKNPGLFFISCFICLIFLELFLRIFNPFPTRVKGEEIILPANQKYIFQNTAIGQLDREIIHTKNSLGFRGKEPPDDRSEYLSIITVGGSAVECFYLSDGHDWPDLLARRLDASYHHIWLNNAGFDGHSTLGHIVLLKDHISGLRPDIILFLVGANDYGREGVSEFESQQRRGRYRTWRDFLKKKSEAASLFLNIARKLHVWKNRLDHGAIDIMQAEILTVPEEQIEKELSRHRAAYIGGYKERLQELIDLCRANGIDPVFITQSTLWGQGLDPVTGVDLGTIELSAGVNSGLYARVLGVYNAATKTVAQDNNVYVIDLAEKMPRNSAYFYDALHFTNEGAEKTAQIVYEELRKYLDNHYPAFRKQR